MHDLGNPRRRGLGGELDHHVTEDQRTHPVFPVEPGLTRRPK